ncbi:MAG: hypothetical protein COU71_01315 [Parcubacteria group bacterium CG10_big_fil_rev_8_21_14_0_10_38_31]|nr:MAG: hypothetical protein COU71_01315 [Parcubacteria group bacterium CG10_big_fil_rev_8_21_14_0_10_38_31]
MRLKRLELSGFKSFARTTRLEFSESVSGVVGPNGSGKSNVAEALRWVLGEQSLKVLRGKKGEDLIFNGSQTAPKLGKASVTLVFDNTDGIFSLDYEEVIITRKVFRDGINEYSINGSKVRLKDIVDILSMAGLGTSQHHIISQGEADRILNTTPKERRSMIEDALGLKIYQIKKGESERKLLKTEDNIKQVESLRREIQPHLRFLKSQVEKYEKTSALREELTGLYKEYISREENYLKKEFDELSKGKLGPQLELDKIEEELTSLKSVVKDKEKTEGRPQEFSIVESSLNTVRKDIASLEREIGRHEGMMEFEKKRVIEDEGKTIPKNVIKDFIHKIKSYLDRNEFSRIKEEVDLFWSGLDNHEESSRVNMSEVKSKHNDLLLRLDELHTEEKKFIDDITDMKIKIDQDMKDYRESERKIYEKEKTANNIRSIIMEFGIKEERLNARKYDIDNEKEEARRLVGEIEIDLSLGVLGDTERDQIKRNISRIRIKLEDSGSVSEDILVEYKEVARRDEFFNTELADMKNAILSLRGLMKELEEKIERGFKDGVEKINGELSELFSIMFGGGRAELEIIKPLKQKIEDEEGTLASEDGVADPPELAGGIDISVNLPKKRINTMAMLSGGERALTSIALLFAMSKVNPPPFLVLDETDAALDETNSSRYGKMLKELSSNIQLIVITHNRETMKQASILYGVTMGSDGISKILSVKLNN